MMANITFLSFLLFSMCHSIHVAVNTWLNCSFFTLINFNKSSCLRIGPRHDVTCANVVSLNGSVIASGALNLQNLKMTDQKRSKVGKRRSWKMTDHITVLVLENTYFYHGENSFTGALSSKFSSIEICFVWCSQTLNITFRRGSQTYAKTY